MKLATKGKDWKIFSESNIQDKEQSEKVHLVKLDFEQPTEEKVEQVIKNFPSTNRFIISDNIKFYNDLLKSRKKYYIENKPNTDLITFMKRNNKVILNVNILKDFEYEFILKNPKDILRNLECLMMTNEQYQEKWNDLVENWTGNILLLD